MAERAKAAPRTIEQLARMDINARSDYRLWCDGWERCMDALAQVVGDLEDELYVRLSASGGGGPEARRKARRAVRPLRFMSTAAKASGRLGPRAFKHYQRTFAAEIDPQRRNRRQAFDHEPSTGGSNS